MLCNCKSRINFQASIILIFISLTTEIDFPQVLSSLTKEVILYLFLVFVVKASVIRVSLFYLTLIYNITHLPLDWLILTVCQSVLSYFMPRNKGIAYIIISLYGTDHIYVFRSRYNFISLKKDKISPMLTFSNRSFIFFCRKNLCNESFISIFYETMFNSVGLVVWLVVLFYGVSTLFEPFNAKWSQFDKSFKPFSFV